MEERGAGSGQIAVAQRAVRAAGKGTADAVRGSGRGVRITVRTLWLPMFAVLGVALGVVVPWAATVIAFETVEGGDGKLPPHVLTSLGASLVPFFLIGLVLVTLGVGLLGFDAYLRHERARWSRGE